MQQSNSVLYYIIQQYIYPGPQAFSNAYCPINSNDTGILGGQHPGAYLQGYVPQRCCYTHSLMRLQRAISPRRSSGQLFKAPGHSNKQLRSCFSECPVSVSGTPSWRGGVALSSHIRSLWEVASATEAASQSDFAL